MRQNPSMTREVALPGPNTGSVFGVVRQSCFIGSILEKVVSGPSGEYVRNPGCPYPLGLRAGGLLLTASWQSAYPRSQAKSKRPQCLRDTTFTRLSPCVAPNLRGAPGSWAATDGWPLF
jgi:hypothetical protein